MILENGLVNTLQKAELIAANKHLFVGYEMTKEEKSFLLHLLDILQDYKTLDKKTVGGDQKKVFEKDLLSKINPLRRKHMFFYLESLVDLGLINYHLLGDSPEKGECYYVTFVNGVKYV